MKHLFTAVVLAATLAAQSALALDVPVKGELKSQVAKVFGEPVKRNAAVGEPPISSWEYPAFTVYFEKDRVIHSVVTQKD